MKLKGGKNSLVVKRKIRNKPLSKKTSVTKSSKEYGKTVKTLETFSSTPLQTTPIVSLKSNSLVKAPKQNKKPLVALNPKKILATKEKKKSRRTAVKHNDELNKKEIKHLLKKDYPINAEDIENAIVGVLKARETNPKLQNLLFEERSPIFLHITYHKVPKGHKQLIRIPLKHSVLTEEDEICLIVPEVKGIGNKEHEKHIEFYENLLRTKEVSNIKKIMTCHEFRTEYETFEQKLRLVDLYDVFLVDGRVSGKIVGKCGKIFYKKRKIPTSIKLQATQLKSHIEKSLSKVALNLHLKGNGYSVQFGHTKMDIKSLVENVYSVMDFLNEKFPIKFENIKGVHIFAPRATSIPIYMSMKFPEDLKTPTLKCKKPKAHKTFTDELTTLLDTRVTVKSSGEVFIHRSSKEDTAETGSDEITDGDMIKRNKDQDESYTDSVKTENVKIKKTKMIDLHVNVKKSKKLDEGIQNEQKMKKNKKKVLKIDKVEVDVGKEHEQKNTKNKINKKKSIKLEKYGVKVGKEHKDTKTKKRSISSTFLENELPVVKKLKKDDKLKFKKSKKLNK